MTVRPSTTCEFSDRPLNAATVRVVRLFAAAIDHSVSPGWTTCGTAAEAVEGTRARAANRTADSGLKRKASLHASGLTPRGLPGGPQFGSAARALTSPCKGRCTP